MSTSVNDMNGIHDDEVERKARKFLDMIPSQPFDKETVNKYISKITISLLK